MVESAPAEWHTNNAGNGPNLLLGLDGVRDRCQFAVSTIGHINIARHEGSRRLCESNRGLQYGPPAAMRVEAALVHRVASGSPCPAPRLRHFRLLGIIMRLEDALHLDRALVLGVLRVPHAGRLRDEPLRNQAEAVLRDVDRPDRLFHCNS